MIYYEKVIIESQLGGCWPKDIQCDKFNSIRKEIDVYNVIEKLEWLFSKLI